MSAGCRAPAARGSASTHRAGGEQVHQPLRPIQCGAAAPRAPTSHSPPRADEAGLLEVVQPRAHRRAGGRGVEADGRDMPRDDATWRVMRPRPRGGGAGGADVGAAVAAGPEHRLGGRADPGLGDLEDVALDRQRDAPDEREAAVLRRRSRSASGGTDRRRVVVAAAEDLTGARRRAGGSSRAVAA